MSNLLQFYFKAAPLLRKMPLTTNPEMERNGADAIHVAWAAGHYVLYIGEAKTYNRDEDTLKHGIVDAVRGVQKHYETHRNELSLYTFEDFLAPELEALACDYLAGKLQLEVHLVCIVTYDDKNAAVGASREEILKSTMDRITHETARVASHPVFKDVPKALLPRLNYIVFPIRELDAVVEEFSRWVDHGQ